MVRSIKSITLMNNCNTNTIKDVKNLLARDISIIITSLNNIMKATSNELQVILITLTLKVMTLILILSHFLLKTILIL